MCGIVVGRNYGSVLFGKGQLKHRGPDSDQIGHIFEPPAKNWWFGHTRLAIVDLSVHGGQPSLSPTGLTMFNGEIYNYQEIYEALETKPFRNNEIYVLDAVMAQASDFMRVLDGDFAIARVERGSGELTLARDFVGVVPLYYQMVDNRLEGAASEKKALTRRGQILEVNPGETLVFYPDGRLKSRKLWDPISLHLRPMDMAHLQDLWFTACWKRWKHSDVPVTVALSGGLDSSLILTSLKWLNAKNVNAVCVVVGESSDEAENATRLCDELGVPLKLVVLSERAIEAEWSRIQYHLEDPNPNPVKWRGMVRNYFVAKEAPGDSKVILSGEGADEIFCGYPQHREAGTGMKLEWKSLGTFRSMPAINLDRVNKGGLAWGKEYRVPFLDRDLVLYVMSCRKRVGKERLRELAEVIGVPDYILNKPKYGLEEDKLGAIYQRMIAVSQAAGMGNPPPIVSRIRGTV